MKKMYEALAEPLAAETERHPPVPKHPFLQEMKGGRLLPQLLMISFARASYVFALMVALTVLTMLGCKDSRAPGHDIRAGIKNFYTYDYFNNYYKHFEEKEDIVTDENYAAFLEYAESFYRNILDAHELRQLAKLYNSEGAIVFRDSVLGLDGKNPLWEFGKTIVLTNSNVLNEISFSPDRYADDNNDDSSGMWTCPLHPHYRADEQGKCAICGMDLSPSEPHGEISNKN